MTSSSIERIATALPIVIGLAPLARVLKRRTVGQRTRGAHAKPSEPGGSTGTTNRGYAIRLASISVFAAVMTFADPHGLVYWTIIGVTVVVLLWEPASWLTAYLVRKANEQDPWPPQKT